MNSAKKKKKENIQQFHFKLIKILCTIILILIFVSSCMRKLNQYFLIFSSAYFKLNFSVHMWRFEIRAYCET